MLRIDVPDKINGISINDNNAINIKILKKGESDNWGDDDCIKNVTIIYACEILIKKAYAHLFDNVSHIDMYRRGYYDPAYCFDDEAQEKHYNNNGDLIFRTKGSG